MSAFDDDLPEGLEDAEEMEEIESFDEIKDDPREFVNEADIAVAAWHEDGRWTLAELSDPYDIAQIITRLKSQQTNGGSIALIAIDEEFFILYPLTDLPRLPSLVAATTSSLAPDSI